MATPSPTQPAPQRLTRFAPEAVLIAGCLCGLITFGPRSSLGLFQIPMSVEFGWGRDVFSLAIALQNLMWGLGQPFAGAVADRFGTVRVFILGAIMYAAGLALMAYAQTPGAMTIGSGVLGFSDFVFSDSGWQDGAYTLITSGGVSGTLDPDLADRKGPIGAGEGELSISDNNLILTITGVGGGGDITPPTLTSITDDVSGGPVTEDDAVTYTVTFSEDMDSTTVTTTDFDNQGTATVVINSVTETAPTSGVFTVVATPSTPGTLRLRIPTGAVLEDTANNELVVPLSDDTEITVISKYEDWSGAADFDADTNGDGVNNGLAFLLGAANKNDNALDLLPEITESGGDLILDFDMLAPASRGDATISVQHSSDLGISDAWESALVPDSDDTINDVVFDITAGSPTGVEATIPMSKAAGGKLFGRLRANP